jgi:hypothetical protein
MAFCRFAYRELKRYHIAEARRLKAAWLVVVRDDETGQVLFTSAWSQTERQAIEVMYGRRGSGEHARLLETLPLRPMLAEASRKAA